MVNNVQAQGGFSKIFKSTFYPTYIVLCKLVNFKARLQHQSQRMSDDILLKQMFPQNMHFIER